MVRAMQHTSNLLIGRPACHSIRRAVLVVVVGRDERWRMPDWLWERDEPLLPEPPFHPSGCQRLRVGTAMDAILLILLVPCTGCSGTRWMRPGSALRVRHIGAFGEWERASAFAEF